MSYVIIDINYKFAALCGKNIFWVSEYPDATVWVHKNSAMQTLCNLQGTGSNIYNLISDYGMSTQETIASVDTLK